MADLQETLDLRRRARRRLIGAIALVLALVIVPPWIMDLEPKPVQSKLTVEIPSQDAARLKPPPKPPVVDPVKPPETGAKPVEPTKPADAVKSGAAPKAADPSKPAESPKAAPAPPASAQPAKSMDARTVAALGAPKTAEPETPPADDKAKHADTKAGDAKPAEPPKKPVETAAKPGSYSVPLGSFSNADNVTQLQTRLAKEGIQTYTEAVKTASGEQTRVRAGPFASREAAERARERVKGMGLDVGNVVARK
jgi:DedD protein